MIFFSNLLSLTVLLPRPEHFLNHRRSREELRQETDLWENHTQNYLQQSVLFHVIFEIVIQLRQQQVLELSGQVVACSLFKILLQIDQREESDPDCTVVLPTEHLRCFVKSFEYFFQRVEQDPLVTIQSEFDQSKNKKTMISEWSDSRLLQ